ncbi:MAG: hypothetical protein ACYTGP_06415 [Planctomycetota bacterium]
MTAPPDDVPPDSTAVPPDAGAPAPPVRPDDAMDDISSLLAEIDALAGGGPPPSPTPASMPTPTPVPEAPLDEVRRQVDEVLTVAPDGGPAEGSEPGATSEAVPAPAAAPETGTPAPPPIDSEPEPASTAVPTRDFVPAAFEHATEPPAEPSALREIDGFLADDAEILLQGNFDTVSEILDDPSAIDDVGRTPAAPVDEPDPATERSAAPEPPAVDHAPTRGGETEVLPARAPADVAPEPLPERPGSERAPSMSTSTREDTHADTDPYPDMDEDTMADLAPLAGPIARESWWSRALPVVITFLCLANLPLRFVPRRVRPVVDWIALSLVFWVPIVWCVALLLIRA